jgi:hypothetical protein
VRYVQEQLLDRVAMERALLEELQAFVTPELKERLWLQADRLGRFLGEFGRLGQQRESARELAHVTRELIEALRIWYAEIELALGGVRSSDVSGEGHRLLAELNPSRCGWAEANL